LTSDALQLPTAEQEQINTSSGVVNNSRVGEGWLES